MAVYKVSPKNKREESLLLSWLKRVGLKFTKPKKPGGGQKKGRKFEKEIAIKLSKWITEGKRDDIFYCSSGSGSRFTARQKQGKDTANSCGDISLLDPIGQPFLNRFSVEIKRGYSEDIDLLSLVDSNNKNNTLIGWIEKALKEIEEADRSDFLIIIKRDRKKTVVVARSDFLNMIDYQTDKTEIEIYVNGDFGVGIVLFDDLFKQFHPEDLAKI